QGGIPSVLRRPEPRALGPCHRCSSPSATAWFTAHLLPQQRATCVFSLGFSGIRPEWGSGGRRFKSSRPDIARAAVTISYSGPCICPHPRRAGNATTPSHSAWCGRQGQASRLTRGREWGLAHASVQALHRASKNTWYVEVGRKQRPLDK